MSNKEKFYSVVYTETTSKTYRIITRASGPEEVEDIIINRRPQPYTIQLLSEVAPRDSDREIVSIEEEVGEVDRDDFTGRVF